MKLDRIIVDAELQSFIPPLAPKERQQLEENITRDGCRDALVLWRDVLIDGHNRHEICTRLKLPYRTKSMEFASRTDVKFWIIRNQFGRRNLKPFQRAELVLLIEPLLAAEAKKNLKTSTGGRNARPLQNSVKADAKNTQAELANLADLSHDTMHKAKVLAAKASENVKVKLRAGETSIDQEYRKIQLQDRDDKKKSDLHTAVEITAPGLVVGDFREKSLAIADDSVELIFTDPPYDRESLGLYEDTARIAARILKPGGSLIAYCGQYLLPEILPMMQQHLRFWWLNACVHDGGQMARMKSYGIVVGWKPLLWFTKGSRGDCQTFVSDIVSGGREKDHHEWQQSESDAVYYIEKLTAPGGLVVDFFAGGGTTCVAAQKLGRSWIAFEINSVAAKSVEDRLLR